MAPEPLFASMFCNRVTDTNCNKVAVATAPIYIVRDITLNGVTNALPTPLC